MTRGSLWTEKSPTRPASRPLGRQLRMLLWPVLVGLLAGALSAAARLHLQLPGHKALFWMPPVVAASWRWPAP